MVEDRLSLQLAKDICVDDEREPKPFLEGLNDSFVVAIRDLAKDGTLDILSYYELQPMPDIEVSLKDDRKLQNLLTWSRSQEMKQGKASFKSQKLRLPLLDWAQISTTISH